MCPLGFLLCSLNPWKSQFNWDYFFTSDLQIQIQILYCIRDRHLHVSKVSAVSNACVEFRVVNRNICAVCGKCSKCWDSAITSSVILIVNSLISWKTNSILQNWVIGLYVKKRLLSCCKVRYSAAWHHGVWNQRQLGRFWTACSG